MDGPILELRDVSHFYKNGRITALKNVSLEVNQGEFLSIIGPSGSGKSTLLYVLCGLEKPTTGDVYCFGKAPESAAQWTNIRANNFGFVFQSYNLFPNMSALENVEMPMFGVVNDCKARKERAMKLLKQVNLIDRANHLPTELSGGQCQRVAIARSLANRPAIILADEPTGNLDSSTSKNIINQLKQINKNTGTALVIVTHDTFIASQADRKVSVVDGKIDQEY